MTAPDISDDWLVANGSNDDGLPLIMRMRSALPTEEIRRAFEHLAIIYLEFEPDDTGLPSGPLVAELQDAEDRLESLIEGPGLGIQAASVTENGTREWHYYVSNQQALKPALQQALANFKNFPISVEICDDPEWNGLADLLESIEDGA